MLELRQQLGYMFTLQNFTFFQKNVFYEKNTPWHFFAFLSQGKTRNVTRSLIHRHSEKLYFLIANYFFRKNNVFLKPFNFLTLSLGSFLSNFRILYYQKMASVRCLCRFWEIRMTSKTLILKSKFLSLLTSFELTGYKMKLRVHFFVFTGSGQLLFDFTFTHIKL